jgi:hypothetical protein
VTIPHTQSVSRASVPLAPVSIGEEATAPQKSTPEIAAPVNCFSGEDVGAILREHAWLDASQQSAGNADLAAWLARAAQLLGPHAPDRASLVALAALVFNYDAAKNFRAPENQSLLAREGAREVIRELARRIFDGAEVDSDRFKEIIDGLKAALPYRGRALFHPIRLALAGRAGEGEFDRVILLLDAAVKLPFAPPVKGTRQRMLEFCAALD